MSLRSIGSDAAERLVEFFNAAFIYTERKHCCSSLLPSPPPPRAFTVITDSCERRCKRRSKIERENGDIIRDKS